MRILITGGAGFIGSELARALIAKGNYVRIIDNLEYGYIENISDSQSLLDNFIQADVRTVDFEKYLQDMDIVYHLAGISSLPECESHPAKTFEVNTTAVARLLSACRHSPVRRVIFSSTSALYENNDTGLPHSEDELISPNLIYATSKLCAEKICQSYADNYELDIIICRFFNVFGPHQDFHRKNPPFTSYIAKELIAGRKPTIFNTANVTRDYIFIDELLNYLIKMGESTRQYHAEIFNIASGNAYSAMQIANEFALLFGRKLEFIEGNPEEFWNKYPQLFDKNKNLSKARILKEIYKDCQANTDKLHHEFGTFVQQDLSTALQKIIDFQKAAQNDCSR